MSTEQQQQLLDGECGLCRQTVTARVRGSRAMSDDASELAKRGASSGVPVGGIQVCCVRACLVAAASSLADHRATALMLTDY